MKMPYSARMPYESTQLFAAALMKMNAQNVIMKVTAILMLRVQLTGALANDC